MAAIEFSGTDNGVRGLVGRQLPANVVPLRVTLRNRNAARARLAAACAASWALGWVAVATRPSVAVPAMAASVAAGLFAHLDRRRSVAVSSRGLELAGLLRQRSLSWSDVTAICRTRRGVRLQLADGRRVRPAALHPSWGAGSAEAEILAEQVGHAYRSSRAESGRHRPLTARPAGSDRHPAGRGSATSH